MMLNQGQMFKTTKYKKNKTKENMGESEYQERVRHLIRESAFTFYRLCHLTY